MTDHEAAQALQRVLGAGWQVQPIEGPPTYREELTPAGLQLCIPGTERIRPQTGKPAQLSLFP
jgi:hypothetical protein